LVLDITKGTLIVIDFFIPISLGNIFSWWFASFAFAYNKC